MKKKDSNGFGAMKIRGPKISCYCPFKLSAPFLKTNNTALRRISFYIPPLLLSSKVVDSGGSIAVRP
jgi:hypothetical protein